MEKRNIIVHIHFFKNAGSTVKALLRQNFKKTMGEINGLQPWNILSPEQFINYLLQNHSLKVVTSEQLQYPLPQPENICLFPIFFLRHPIDRMGSIYSFEKRQTYKTPGSVQAKKLNFREYTKWRLLDGVSPVFRNFHVTRLSSCYTRLMDARQTKPTLKNLKEAKQHLQAAPFFGVVEFFHESIGLLKNYLQDAFPELDYHYTIQNVSPERLPSLQQRIDKMESDLGRTLYNKLIKHNAFDIELYEYALNLMQSMISRNQ